MYLGFTEVMSTDEINTSKHLKKHFSCIVSMNHILVTVKTTKSLSHKWDIFHDDLLGEAVW